jgi:hypothetical protein
VWQEFQARVQSFEAEDDLMHSVWLDIAAEAPEFFIPPLWVTNLRPGRSESEEAEARYVVDVYLSWTPGRGAQLHGFAVRTIRNRELPKRMLPAQDTLLWKAVSVAARTHIPKVGTPLTAQERIAVIESTRRQMERSDWTPERNREFAARLRELHEAGASSIHGRLAEEFDISVKRSQTKANELREQFGEDLVPKLRRGRPKQVARPSEER